MTHKFIHLQQTFMGMAEEPRKKETKPSESSTTPTHVQGGASTPGGSELRKGADSANVLTGRLLGTFPGTTPRPTEDPKKKTPPKQS